MWLQRDRIDAACRFDVMMIIVFLIDMLLQQYQDTLLINDDRK